MEIPESIKMEVGSAVPVQVPQIGDLGECSISGLALPNAHALLLQNCFLSVRQ
jgi:uncharacterized protein (UPF0303 family)